MGRNSQKAFCVKQGTNLGKYDFVELDDRWVYRKKKLEDGGSSFYVPIKIVIHKKDMIMRFNAPTSEELGVFYELIKAGKVKMVELKKGSYYYLTEEEYKSVLEARERKNEK